jgi:hypothetical protein
MVLEASSSLRVIFLSSVCSLLTAGLLLMAYFKTSFDLSGEVVFFSNRTSGGRSECDEDESD